MVMTRWIRNIIWGTGSIILSCPFCVCFSGGGSWWVCACTVGLLSITMISGYSTWSVISQVLNDSSSYSQYFSRLYTFKEDIIPKEKEPESTLTPGDDASFIEKEISVTAQAFHSHLVLPWYSYISPDDKYSLQIRSTLEDLLTGVFKNLKQHTNVSVLFQHILTLYIQHFRQFYKALKKVSQKHKKRPIDCVNEKEDIREFYKPIHIALRTDDGIQLHFQRLAHLLLINYLPTEITRCNLLFLCLKDLFAQNILKITLDVICDTKWLNETLVSALDQTEGKESHEHTKDVADKLDEERVEAKAIKEARVWCYTHSLSAIREETSIEVLDPDLPFYESGIPLDLKRFNGVLNGRNLSPQKNRKQGESLVLSEKKIENTHALLKYVQQSSILDRESNPRSKRTVATALGDLISTTTVPLLPEAITFPSKMWESPLEEEMKPVPSIKKNPFRKNIVEGLTETDYKAKMIKAPTGISAFLERQVLGSKKGTLNVVNSMIASELQRSKSLSNLPSKIEEGEELEKLHANHKLSSSSETLPRGWSSADDVNQNELKDTEDLSKKSKACLKKMNSFDKNDGLDEFSLAYFDATHEASEVGGCSSLGSLSPTEKSTPTMDFKEHAKCIAVSPTSMSSSSSTLGGDDLAQRPSHNSLELPLSPTSDALKEFGWENPDLSPIYEESENLASTIAKLRCLLSERQSQHSLGSQSSFGSSESEPKSAQSDPGRYNLERSRFTFYHKDSSGSLASVKSSSSTDSSYLHWTNEEEILEASEVPIDGKLFVSISIPATEVHNESAGFQYTMYTIQYDAIYLCEIVPPSGGMETSNESAQFADHKMVLQTNIVKRRFREFLSLHSALEEDATLRGCMKGIKGPNKWLNLPFSKLDSATITSRKQFLEKYLQALIQRAALNTSAPLKDFLAYTSDSSISFVKKPLEINVPRLDKLLARTVSGVFHSIKTALPTFDSAETPLQGGVVPFSLNAAVANGGKGNFHVIPEGSSIDKDRQESFKNDPLYDFDVQLDITAEEQVCELEGSLLAAITSTSELGSPVENATEAQDLNAELFFTNPVPFLPKNTCSLITFNPLYQEGDENPSNNVSHLSSQSNPLASFWAEIGLTSSRLYPLRRHESQESLGTGESEHENSHPLFLALVDTLVEIIGSTDHPLTRQGATLLITRLWAQPITNYIQSKLDHVLTEDLFQVFFNRVRYCIVNTGEQSKNESTSDQPDYETKTEESKEKLKHALKKFIPSVLEFMLGSESTCESLTLFVESLQHPTLSKDLGLHLIDLIFVHLLLPV